MNDKDCIKRNQRMKDGDVETGWKVIKQELTWDFSPKNLK